MSDVAARLEAIYARIPAIECKGQCWESCGPIQMTPAEARRADLPTLQAELRCPKLDFAGRCTVYERRPLICRLWGVARGMDCGFGCKPERVLEPEEAGELMVEIQAVGGEIPRVERDFLRSALGGLKAIMEDKR